MKKSLRAITAFAVIILLIVATAAACSGRSGSTAASSYVATTAAAAMDSNSYGYEGGAMPQAATVAETAAAVMEEWGVEADEIAYDNGLAVTGGSPAPAGGAAVEASEGENASLADGSESAKTARKLIRTVNLNVETTEFDALLDSITRFVEDSGGYIEQSDLSGKSISGGNGRRFASVTARVPSDQVDAFLSQMNEKSNVTYRSENVQDVTLQYTDIESRKKSLTIEQDRLWELLEKADSLDAVIALEERLSEIRYELEKFESQLRTYDNQVDYSTVYISIDEVAVFTPTEPDSVMTRIQKGFTRNLRNVGNGFVDFFVWFVSSLPTLLVWAVFIAAIAVIVRFLVRRFLRNRRQRPETPHVPHTKQPSASKSTAPDSRQGVASDSQQGTATDNRQDATTDNRQNAASEIGSGVSQEKSE